MDADVPRTRLVHITTVPFSLVYLVGQIGYLKERGFDICAISSPGEGLHAFAQREAVRSYEVEMPRRISPLRDLFAVRKICQALRKIRPQIVHASTPKGGLLGMMAGWLLGVPVRIYHIRGLTFMTAHGPKRLLLRWTERVACKLAHRVFCVSHSIREVAVSERLCAANKITVFHGGSSNGVDADGRFNPLQLPNDARRETRARYGIPNSAVVVGFVGRVVRDKGICELAAAWQLVREEFPAAHLLIVGPSEPHDPLSPDVVALLNEDPRIHLAGEDWNTSLLYAGMDLVVLPTYREGFPNVLLEAAAMGLPSVATRVPGCTDAIQDGVTGTLVPLGDVAALVDAIRAYLARPELRAKHGMAGRSRVLRDFRQEAIWDAVYQEYCRLLREKDLPVPSPVAVKAADFSYAGSLAAGAALER